MKCEKHPEREAIGVCANCGKAICAECRVEIEDKNYCKDCVSELFEEEKKADLKLVMKKFDITLFIGPILAIVASFLPWITVRILLVEKDINALNMQTYIGTYMGTIYFLLALAAFGIAWIPKPSTKAKGLISVGILMVISSVMILSAVSYAISQMESEFEGDPFGASTGLDIGIGLILAIIASIIIVYTGYKMISPDLSTQVPNIRSRKVLIVINYIMVLWTLIFSLLFLFLIMGRSRDDIGSLLYDFGSVIVVSYLIMFVTYFYISYVMLKLAERYKIVYSAFIGFTAVLILLIGVAFYVEYNMLAFIGGFASFALIPLLVYLADLRYAWK
jgi:hypothetical protein